MQLFFCRSDLLSVGLPDAVLRSDPSIVCWDSAHIAAFVFAVLLFAIFGVATPLLLLQRIRKELSDQDESNKLRRVADSRLTSEEEGIYKALFSYYDADSNGWIDEEELSCILEQQARIKPTVGEIHGLKQEWLGLSATEQITLDDFLKMMSVMKLEMARSGNSQMHALNDPLCLLYYPMKRECYWWTAGLVPYNWFTNTLVKLMGVKLLVLVISLAISGDWKRPIERDWTHPGGAP